MSCKGCNNVVMAGPTPYYEKDTQEIQQDHTTLVSQRCYPASIRIIENWNVPTIGALPLALTLLNVHDVVVGTYIYSPQYGYFKITNWNPKTRAIGIINENIDGVAADGSYVPSYTPFIIQAKPCCEQDTSILFPFLAEDFVAPAISLSITIKVTSTFGLKLGDLVRVGTGVYRLTQILSSRQVIITNEGAGVQAGDTVEALDGNGKYQYLIVPDNASACSSASVYEGRAVVCDGLNARILKGDYNGQIPVLVDYTENLVQYKLLDVDTRVCTSLTQTVNILFATSDYVINVEDTTGFTVNDTIQLNFSALRFIITAIGANTLDISSTPSTPGVTVDILVGSTVCKILSSEYISTLVAGSNAGLQTQINTLTTNLGTTNTNLATEATARNNADNSIITNFQAADGTLQNNINSEAANRVAADAVITDGLRTYFGASVAPVGATLSDLTVAGQESDSDVASLTIQNTGTRTMVAMVTFNYRANGWWTSAFSGYDELYFITYSEARIGPIGTVVFSAFDQSEGYPIGHQTGVNGAVQDGYHYSGSFCRAFSIGAGEELKVRAKARIYCQTLQMASLIHVSNFSVNIGAVGVAV